MKHRNLAMAIVVFGAFAVLGGIFWWGLLAPPAEAEHPVDARQPTATVVCGKFAAPPLLVGTPVSVSNAITFNDGYLLQLKEVPSLFIGKRALFQIVDGVVVNYGLVAEDYNPCPVKP